MWVRKADKGIGRSGNGAENQRRNHHSFVPDYRVPHLGQWSGLYLLKTRAQGYLKKGNYHDPEDECGSSMGGWLVIRGKLTHKKTKAKRGGIIKTFKADKDKAWVCITFPPHPDIFKQIVSS